MYTFEDNKEKITFLKKYGLMPKTFTTIPTYYFYDIGQTIPNVCEIIGYEDMFETWATVTIKSNDKIVNIHSDYLLEMKKKGTIYYKKKADLKENSVKTELPEIITESKDTYVVLDLETTGTNNKVNEIIEIAAIKVAPNSILEFSELVKIDNIIPLNITALTGITNEMVFEADPIDIVLPKFIDFVGNSPLIGHNIKSFDMSFINKACTSLGLSPLNNKLIDTLSLARKALPNLTNHKLSTICDFFGIDKSNAHRALADCYMCNECYKRLLDKPNTNSDDSPTDTDIVLKSNVNNINNEFEEKVLNMLKEISLNQEFPENSLYLYSNRSKTGTETSKSICLHEPDYPSGSTDVEYIGKNASFAKIGYLKKQNKITLTVKAKRLKLVSLPPNAEVIMKESKVAPDKADASVQFMDNDPTIYRFIHDIILIGLKYYEPSASFGCCSQFNRCSDEKKCVHENKLYAKGCKYRANLDNNRIFYGKNRNID